ASVAPLRGGTYFSLRRQRKVGAAPHRGNTCEPEANRGCSAKAKKPNRLPNTHLITILVFGV
ncbi:hypothetical protein, partial [Paraburkholderia caribensis]|uniref:hypothetical protein n=1 Tax=Paraburkholderia caribensis TaxID=75105 RepID=UPI001CC57832